MMPTNEITHKALDMVSGEKKRIFFIILYKNAKIQE